MTKNRQPIQGPPAPLLGGIDDLQPGTVAHYFVEPISPGARGVGRCSRCSRTRLEHAAPYADRIFEVTHTHNVGQVPVTVAALSLNWNYASEPATLEFTTPSLGAFGWLEPLNGSMPIASVVRVVRPDDVAALRAEVSRLASNLVHDCDPRSEHCHCFGDADVRAFERARDLLRAAEQAADLTPRDTAAEQSARFAASMDARGPFGLGRD